MKQPISTRIDNKLLERAKKLAETNKRNFKYPQTVTAIIEEALADYLSRQKSK